jgi:hypothetical protein
VKQAFISDFGGKASNFQISRKNEMVSKEGFILG